MGRQRPLLADALALTGLAALYHFRTRPWMYTWGARDEELTAPLPGDELVAGDPVRTTRAVTVDAPVSDVWPWVAQIGEDRGGFYSYWLLERAVGAGIHNADVIHPEWQDCRWVTPSGWPAATVRRPARSSPRSPRNRTSS